MARLTAHEDAVGELGAGLVHGALDGLVLPEVDDLCQPVQQDDLVPAHIPE